jgi:hypothetical protein
MSLSPSLLDQMAKELIGLEDTARDLRSILRRYGRDVAVRNGGSAHSPATNLSIDFGSPHGEEAESLHRDLLREGILAVFHSSGRGGFRPSEMVKHLQLLRPWPFDPESMGPRVARELSAMLAEGILARDETGRYTMPGRP